MALSLFGGELLQFRECPLAVVLFEAEREARTVHVDGEAGRLVGVVEALGADGNVAEFATDCDQERSALVLALEDGVQGVEEPQEAAGEIAARGLDVRGLGGGHELFQHDFGVLCGPQRFEIPARLPVQRDRAKPLRIVRGGRNQRLQVGARFCLAARSQVGFGPMEAGQLLKAAHSRFGLDDGGERVHRFIVLLLLQVLQSVAQGGDQGQQYGCGNLHRVGVHRVCSFCSRCAVSRGTGADRHSVLPQGLRTTTFRLLP